MKHIATIILCSSALLMACRGGNDDAEPRPVTTIIIRMRRDTRTAMKDIHMPARKRRKLPAATPREKSC